MLVVTCPFCDDRMVVDDAVPALGTCGACGVVAEIAPDVPSIPLALAA
jgi:transcription initiation factor TFIIIB Brf1 subunit/transcription initiation factor TFIIB